MILISKLLQAARTWRSRRNGPKTTRRSSIAVEQLDHRRLLSVNFTGNVATDFPATESPGVVVFNSSNTPNIQHPIIPPSLSSLINVSGFDISEIRVSYDSTNDTLDIGLNQPDSGNAGQPGPVIAGDADDNGTAGSVNPAVEAAAPGFTEFPQMGGSDEMAVSLNFTGTDIPQIVAGYSPNAPTPTPTNPNPVKSYEVAEAIPNSSDPAGIPAFGTALPNYTGNVYLVQTAANPSLEFSISHFSQLYQMETGKALTSTSVVGIGGFAGSLDDIGISDAFFPLNTFTVSQATEPISTCPPQSPVIYVNPHEHRIIDTLHRDLIRVTIEGTSGFKVGDINPSTVTLDGVPAVAHITRKTRRDEFPFATYVFVADQLKLPPGLDNVTLSGTLNNGVTQFSSTTAVLNIPNASRVTGRLHAYMGGGTIYRALSKIEAKHPGTVAISSSSATAVSVSHNPAPGGVAKLKVSYAPVLTARTSRSTPEAARVEKPRQVISIKRAEGAAEASPKLPTLLRHSLSEHLDHLGSASSAA
jgi:hypothetical protein